jgi:hypothetical protein
MHLRDRLAPEVAEMVYYGFWYHAKMDALMAFIKDVQKPRDRRSDAATLQRQRHQVAGRTSPNSLYDEAIASMEGRRRVYNQTDAEGFFLYRVYSRFAERFSAASRAVPPAASVRRLPRRVKGLMSCWSSKQGGRIVEIVAKSGDTFAAKTFIDAGYEGDLMAAAGVSWTIGREGRREYGESLAGRQYPKRPMAISGLDAGGKPLPLITAVEPVREAKESMPDDQLGDKNVMVYSFRLCLTDQPENHVPFPKPANYDPARFEAVRRYYKADPKALLAWDLYPLPGGKFDANNGIGKQFSMGIVGGGNTWCEADEAGRREIWEAHKQYTLELYHFLTTDEAVPQPLREQLAKLGLCQDEFASYDHWSPQLYVREGRRMLGEYVLTQADILNNRTKPDSIAVCSFPIDSHDCRRVARGEQQVVNEGTIFPKRVRGTRQGPAYQVPYRAITPKAGECDNLLVPTALSSTHVAYSSVRVEPSWMTIGQASGIAAALAAKLDTKVQDLPYAELAAKLQAQNQVLDHPATKGSVEVE